MFFIGIVVLSNRFSFPYKLQYSLLRSDGSLLDCLHLDVQIWLKMNYKGKQRWGSLVNPFGGSVPNLLSPGLGSCFLKKHLSMDTLRGWAPDLSSLSMGLSFSLSTLKLPSAVTVCKWKQGLTERLLKRFCGNVDESSQVRKHTGTAFLAREISLDIDRCPFVCNQMKGGYQIGLGNSD